MPAGLAPLAALHLALGPAAGEPGVVAALARAAAPWREAYSDHTAVSTVVIFTHLAALVVGGGLAIAADRATLRADRGAAATADAERGRRLAELADTHRLVVASLAVAFASGALLFLADVEEFARSPAFWAKMALVAALLANGYGMTRAERGMAGGAAPGAGGWRRLRRHAAASVALWIATILAGTILTNA